MKSLRDIAIVFKDDFYAEITEQHAVYFILPSTDTLRIQRPHEDSSHQKSAPTDFRLFGHTVVSEPVRRQAESASPERRWHYSVWGLDFLGAELQESAAAAAAAERVLEGQWY